MKCREKFIALKRRIEKTNKRTLEERKKNRKNERKVKEPRIMTVDSSFGLASPEPKQETKKREPNSTDVREWFEYNLKKKFGDDFIVPAWTVHQKKLGKGLLTMYGHGLVKKSVAFFCNEWDNIVESSRGNIDGVPTINLLWSMRERIFGNVQTGRKPGRKKARSKNADEYKPSNAPKSGW